MSELDVVSFTAMEHGTAEDFALIDAHDAHNAKGLADRLLDAMASMDGESPYRISRLEHSLQSATRAEADGADEETIVVALLHDIGDVFSPLNHSQVAAAILRPYVSEKNWWIVQHHGLFQGYYWFEHYGRNRDLRDKYKDHPHYQATVEFCANWDQNCFDPEYTSKPLSHFAPMVRSIFARKPTSFV